jgi:uncharacterized protein
MTSPTQAFGDTSLPLGCQRPHASEEAGAIAEAGTILKVQVGSGAPGISIRGRDDHYDQRHTVLDRPGGLANRSGAGDLGVVIDSARKWCRLALAGNPTVR